MPSQALIQWRNERSKELDEIDAAHKAVGGTKRGRRFATRQLNRAYAILLASRFQGFCRDLHTECARLVINRHVPASAGPIVLAQLTDNRQLKRANAQPGSIGADFGRLGVRFWYDVLALDGKNKSIPRFIDGVERLAERDRP